MHLSRQMNCVRNPGGRAWPIRTPAPCLKKREYSALCHAARAKGAGSGKRPGAGGAAEKVTARPSEVTVEGITAAAAGLALMDLERLQRNIANLICTARLPASLAHLNIKFSKMADGAFSCELQGVKLTGCISETSWLIASGTMENRRQDFALGPLTVEAHSHYQLKSYNKVEGLKELRAQLDMNDLECTDFNEVVGWIVDQMSDQEQFDLVDYQLTKALEEEE